MFQFANVTFLASFHADRESNLPFARGRWEPQQLVDLYVVHPDGSGLERITPHGNFCGSPKFWRSSSTVVKGVKGKRSLNASLHVMRRGLGRMNQS